MCYPANLSVFFTMNKPFNRLRTMLKALTMMPRIRTTWASKAFYRYSGVVLRGFMMNVVRINVSVFCCSPLHRKLLSHKEWQKVLFCTVSVSSSDEIVVIFKPFPVCYATIERDV